MKSVLNQDWPDVEYIIIDPGSTDETPSVVREFMGKYPDRITYIREPDKGPADGLNKGFARASGELLGYINADDFYLPGCFRSAVEAAKKYPNAGSIYADGYRVGVDGSAARRIVSTKFGPKRFLYGGTLVLQQSTFYRAEAFRKVGGFNAENQISWDIEIILDMAKRKMQLVHVPGYWSVFRIHPESITGSQRLAEQGRLTRARYFQTIMGRPKTRWDQLATKFVFGYSLLVEPRGTAMRLLDRIAPPNIPLP